MENTTHQILVVDASVHNRDIVSRILTHQGYGVQAVEDGYAALEALDTGTFDLVLLDLMMPGLTGFEVLAKVRQTYSPVELPIIMITADVTSLSTVQCLKAGANDYVTKPIDVSVTIARIEAALEVKDAADSQTGELRKILTKSHPMPSRAVFFCPRCLTAYRGQIRGSCHNCGKPQPQWGWPPICDTPRPYLGRILGGRYFMEQYIAEGALGSVFQARDIDTERQFAIKVVDFGEIGYNLREKAQRQMLIEIQALTCLDNPYIVKLFQVLIPEEDVWAIVMDFCRGEALETLIMRQGRMDPWLAINITHQVASALHETHARGLLHRDIKPANIMLEQMTTGAHFVKVLDFGLAQTLGRATKEICGTPEYIAPEAIKVAAIVDGRADIYSLGATLFEMLVGDPPFQGKITEVLTDQMEAPVPSITAILGDTPLIRALDKIVHTMMAKEADFRFQNASELLAALKSLDRFIGS